MYEKNFISNKLSLSAESEWNLGVIISIPFELFKSVVIPLSLSFLDASDPCRFR